MANIETLRRDLNQVLGEYYFQNDEGTVAPFDPDLYVHATALAGLEGRKDEYKKSMLLFEEALTKFHVLKIRPSYAQLEELLRLYEGGKKALL